MKKLIFAALLAVSVSTFAQDKKEMDKKSDRNEKGTPEQKNAMRLKKLTTDLNLDAKQQEKIKQIIAEQNAHREAMMAERMANKDNATEPTPEELKDRRQKGKEARKAMEDKLKTILSPEQLEKWNAIEEAHKAKMKEAKEGKARKEGKEECHKGKKECKKGKEDKE